MMLVLLVSYAGADVVNGTFRVVVDGTSSHRPTTTTATTAFGPVDCCHSYRERHRDGIWASRLLSFVPRTSSSSTSVLIKFDYNDNDDIGNCRAIRRAIVHDMNDIVVVNETRIVLSTCRLRPQNPTILVDRAPPSPPLAAAFSPLSSFHARRCPPCLSPPSTLLIVIVVPLLVDCHCRSSSSSSPSTALLLLFVSVDGRGGERAGTTRSSCSIQ